MDGQCSKLVTVSVASLSLTLTVDICVQHGGPEAPRRAGLSAVAETCYQCIGLSLADSRSILSLGLEEACLSITSLTTASSLLNVT